MLVLVNMVNFLHAQDWYWKIITQILIGLGCCYILYNLTQIFHLTKLRF